MEEFSKEQLAFEHPFTMKLSGNRRVGKTHFTKTLLLNNHELITPRLDVIIWFYGAMQQSLFAELEDSLQRGGQKIEFVHDLPQDGKTIQDVICSHVGRKLVVFDDLMEKVGSRADVAALFTHGRHEDVSVIFLTQNLFHKSKYARDMSLNVDYMVLFKNPRDASVITHLGQQMGNTKFLQQAFRDATKEPFSYLLIDLRAQTPEVLRYRTRVFNSSGDEPQTVYQPQNL